MCACIYIYIYIYIHLSVCKSAEASLPEAFCLKPCPFACHWQTKSLSLGKKSLIDRLFVCQCMQKAKESRVADRLFVCQSMNFAFFLWFIWFFGITDREKVCQQCGAPSRYSYLFFLQAFCLSSPCKNVPLRDKKSVSAGKDEFFVCQCMQKCATDRQKVCQWSHIAQWKNVFAIGSWIFMSIFH